MTINEIINLKYYDLAKHCDKNIIKSCEINSGLRSIEQLDLLHDMLIRFLKKYADTEFESLEIGYQQIKCEFLAEKNIYSKLVKPNSLLFTELIIDR